MRTFLSITGWITAVIFAACFLNQKKAVVTAQQKADTLSQVLTQKLPQVIAQAKAAKDSSKAVEQRQIKREQDRPQSDTGVYHKIDTVQNNLRRIIASNKNSFDVSISKKNDTLKLLRSENLRLTANLKSSKDANMNIAFLPYDKLPKANDTSAQKNAAIYLKPIKKSSNQSIFSPQKNYFRAYNQIPGGLVNGQPYFDYEQTNDEINQLLFQGRIFNNLATGTTTLGIGAELKLNRSGINVLISKDPFSSRRPQVTIGLRQDIYRIRFN